MTRPEARRFAAYLLFVAVGVGGMWRVETTAHRAQDAADAAQLALDELEADRLAARIAACEKDDRTNATVRQIGKDIGITSGVTGGEALIGIAQDAPKETVDAYRSLLTKLLDPALAGIVNTLPGYRWDPKAGRCVEVPLDTGG